MSGFPVKIMKIDGSLLNEELSLVDAFDLIHADKADIILAKVDNEKAATRWWADHDALGMNNHKYHPGITTSGMTIGKLQRASDKEYPEVASQYFRSAEIVNESLLKTNYYHFFEKELGVTPYSLADGERFLIASQREYPASQDRHFSFAPHSDSISFSRAAQSWPVKMYDRQVAAFITIQNADNNAGFVMWDYAPKTRSELDEFYQKYSQEKETAMNNLDVRGRIDVEPRVGELCIFNCRKMHAVKSCSSLRRTIGSFFIQDNGWRIFD